MLTIISPNRNRLDPQNKSTQFFIKSLQWQDNKDFNIIIIDGGSDNYEELKEYIKQFNNIELLQYKINGQWNKTLLNNYAIRYCKSEYIATTDCDMLFDRHFTSVVIPLLKRNLMIESRTMYLKEDAITKIHSGEVDPYTNIKSCHVGRIKKRTTPGGFQCLHKDDWHKIRGYNEEIIGWGSEDVELVERVYKNNINVHWLGENNDIMLFHQPHPKKIEEELSTQAKNKIILEKTKFTSRIVNKYGWGSIKD